MQENKINIEEHVHCELIEIGPCEQREFESTLEHDENENNEQLTIYSLPNERDPYGLDL